tara:strand:- start:176 stop:724 length:549 start_codon:yes stop_codon:yes gene_type:complete
MKLKKFIFKNINSTNDTAIRIIKTSKTKCGIVVTKNQKKGKGQRGKKWISYKGNLFVSIFFPIYKNNLSLRKMTKINCLLIKKLISNYYKGEILIKKPNDLFIQKKKISGILQEIIHKSNETFIIVGIGINLIKSPHLKKYPTTNIKDLINVKISHNNAILKLIKIYEKYIPNISKLNMSNF